MKYIFLFVIAFFLMQEIPAQVRLSTMDSITTFAPYDYSYWNTLSGGNYLNRKVSWTALRAGMIDYIDGLANTWALKQTYSSGATFSTGSNGTVDIQDSALTTGLWTNWLHARQAVTYIGSTTDPFFNVYSRNFVVVNPYENDSVYISYEDSTLSFDKALRFPSLTITETVGIDSGATLSAIIYDNVEYTVSSAADSIITLTTYSPSVQLILPADVTSPGISRIHMNEATKGQIVRFWVSGGSYDITFTDTIGDDDNLDMAGDITLSYLDNITFQYVGLSGGKQIWMETGRSNN